jgi:hypothetical protein
MSAYIHTYIHTYIHKKGKGVLRQAKVAQGDAVS